MTGFSAVLDCPTELAEGDATTSTHPIARIGSYADARYGKFAITAAQVKEWSRKLHDLQDGRVRIDYDHASEKAGGSTEAAGWVTDIKLAGEHAVATIEWTPQGAQAVRDKRWLYVSPAFGDYIDEQKRNLGDALRSVALTNRPFLRKGMPAISLSEDVPQDTSVAALDTTGPAEGLPDTPPTMPDLKTFALAAGLPEDADEATILAAVTEQSKRPETAGTKTLEAQAADAGKVLLDAAEITKLRADATAGAEAKEDLRVGRFETAFATVLSEGRADTTDETKQLWRDLFDANEAKTLEALGKLPKVVNLDGPLGSAHSPKGTAPEGQDPERYELNERVGAYQAEHPGTDYLTALDAVRAVEA